MRNSIEILREFNELLESEKRNMLKAIDLVSEMKKTDPDFVELMINCLYEDEEE